MYYSGTVQCTAGKDFTDGKEGDVFIFRPENPVKVSRAERNPAKLRVLHGEGYRIGMMRFDELMRWLHG